MAYAESSAGTLSRAESGSSAAANAPAHPAASDARQVLAVTTAATAVPPLTARVIAYEPGAVAGVRCGHVHCMLGWSKELGDPEPGPQGFNLSIARQKVHPTL